MVPTASGFSAAPASPVTDIDSPYTLSLTLEVLHGRTRYPQRPVTGTRCTIGSGIACDLRLGGDDMPALHSLIVLGEDEITIETMAAEPELSINGEVTRTKALTDGDVIRIGGVEMLARVTANRLPAAMVEMPVTEIERLPEEMSALELVEQIEQEQALIDEFEAQQKLGEDAILEAILSRRRSASRRELHAGSSGEIAKPHFRMPRRQREIYTSAVNRATQQSQIMQANAGFLHDLEQLAQSLGDLSHELQQTTLRATEREAGYATATEVLLEAQEKLASQFETLLSQVESLREERQPLRTRAIA